MSRLLEAPKCRKRSRPQQSCSSLPHTKVPARKDVVLRLSEMNALRFAANHIPERIPKRWDMVSRFVADITDEISADVQVILPGVPELPYTQSIPTHLREVHKSICQSWPAFSHCNDTTLQAKMGMYPDKTGLKHLVLLPPVKECCDSPTTIRNRPSFPLVYTMQGTLVAAMYTAECKHCSRKYHLSYYQEASDDSQSKQCFMTQKERNFFKSLHKLCLRLHCWMISRITYL